MCLIVETRQETPMTRDFIDNVIKRNDDGFGMMWVDANKVHIHKSPTNTLDEVWAAYEPLIAKQPIVHFRMKTHGGVDEVNTHPYPCGNNIWLMHNGILKGGNTRDIAYSDTWHFIEDVMKPLLAQVKNPEEFVLSPVFVDMMEEYTGYNNKLVVMSRKGYVKTWPGTWHTIKNHWTSMVGIEVSNTYAWSERDFRDPTPPAVPKLSKKAMKRLARIERRRSVGFSAGGETVSILLQQDGTTAGRKNSVAPFNYGKPEDHWRKDSAGLEEYNEDFFLDIHNNVWGRTPNGYRRIHGMSFSDLCARSRRIAEKNGELNEDSEEKTTTIVVPENRIEIPALVMPKRSIITVNDPGTEDESIDYSDEEIEEAIDKLATHGYDEQAYADALISAWKEKTSDEIAELIITNPEEACVVLERALSIQATDVTHV